MDGYSVTPIKLGTIVRKKSNMVYGAGDELTEFPLLAFYLEGNGHKILVDTGGSAPDGAHWMPYTRPPEESLPAALAAIGVSPHEIDSVFFTHLHWDHAGNNHLLTNATFYAQRAEYKAILEKDLPGYERDLVLKSSYTLLDGDIHGVLPGISVYLTPGHSVGSQSIVAQAPSGPVVLAGDLIPTYENIEKHVPNGGNYDLKVITDSVDRVLALGGKIFPGHERALVR